VCRGLPAHEMPGTSSGQVLKEALSSDKLEDDFSYRVSAFIGVSFRFSKNPFKKAGGDGS